MDLGLVSMYVGAFCACKMGFTLIFVLVSFVFVLFLSCYLWMIVWGPWTLYTSFYPECSLG